jgi:uncharacterized membrane protein YraQ (UPF0718 family)
VQRQWLGHEVLRNKKTSATQGIVSLIRNGWLDLKNTALKYSPLGRAELILAPVAPCCESNAIVIKERKQPAHLRNVSIQPQGFIHNREAEKCGCKERTDFWSRLLNESVNATLMVLKFMALAFFLEALIILYVPAEWITGVMGQQNSWAIITAAILGVPTYTSNLSALPMVSGLLAQGMSPAAALAFLVAGPTTTLPAMAAVWSLVTHRVFALYVSFALAGAIILGYLKLIIG